MGIVRLPLQAVIQRSRSASAQSSPGNRGRDVRSMADAPFTNERPTFQVKRPGRPIAGAEAIRATIPARPRWRGPCEDDRMMGSLIRQHATHTGEPAVDGNEPERRARARWTGPNNGPATCDVLASKPTARADVYAISLFPSPAVVVEMAHYADAIEKVREMARSMGVDGWFTCDHTHYAQVAKYRNSAAGERKD
jgi:hypothetical protein